MKVVQGLVAVVLLCAQAIAQMSPTASPALLSSPTYMTELQQASQTGAEVAGAIYSTVPAG